MFSPANPLPDSGAPTNSATRISPPVVQCNPFIVTMTRRKIRPVLVLVCRPSLHPRSMAAENMAGRSSACLTASKGANAEPRLEPFSMLGGGGEFRRKFICQVCTPPPSPRQQLYSVVNQPLMRNDQKIRVTSGRKLQLAKLIGLNGSFCAAGFVRAGVWRNENIPKSAFQMSGSSQQMKRSAMCGQV